MSEIFSVNQFKAWSKCKKRYYYDYVKKLYWPTDQSHFRLGRDLHKLLDYQSRELDCALLLKDAEADVRQSWEKLNHHPTSQLPIVASEWAFQVPVGGCWIVGRIDRISRDGENLLIIDWKTGTSAPKTPETDWQTMIYLYATVEAVKSLGFEGFPPERIRFVYVEVKETVRESVIPYSTQKHQQFRKEIENTLMAIQQETVFPLPKVCPDKYCPYRAICGIEA